MSAKPDSSSPSVSADIARYIQIIRNALWRNKAAVMIGSGFSRNAQPIAASFKSFPLWSDLTNRLFDDLYPSGRGSESLHEKKRASLTTRALEIAERYEATFGRTQLDNLLLELIPDGEYEPGELHKLLLRLPWADILTTNYDSLLERTRESISARNYDLVQSVADIAHSCRPRIVKLHGSFPSSRPFIVTEEDFRTYPRRFAGFVNLAQQVAMENVLCLIGFAGDDPNFLEWTGWVRDHLGEHSPRIYLCGLFDHDEITRSLLQRRNVTALNLSEYFPISNYTDSASQHRDATGWLLRSFDQDPPTSTLKWPESNKPSKLSVPTYWPPLVSSKRISPVAQPRDLLNVDDLRMLRDVWRHNRLLYPGWVIAPSRGRYDIFWSIRNIESKLCELIPTATHIEQLTILFELNWLLETCMCPILNGYLPLFEKCLQNFSLFPNEWDSSAETECVFGRMVLPKLRTWDFNKRNWQETVTTWDNIKQSWLSVSMGVLRHYREERRDIDFQKLYVNLSKISSLSVDQRSGMAYERSLFYLERFNDAAAREAIELWPTSTADPMWAIRRAGMLAELGEHETAKQVSNATLDSIRQSQRAGFDSIPVYSREGWASRLAIHMDYEHHSSYSNGLEDDERDRWRELDQWDCNPNFYIRELEEVSDNSAPRIPRSVSDTYGFQPGTFGKSYSTADLFIKILPAYQAIRFCEQIGEPLRADLSTRPNIFLKAAARWFAEIDEVRSLSIICRTGDEKLINQFFSRHRIAVLPMETIENLFESTKMYISSVIGTRRTLKFNDFDPRVMRIRRRLDAAVAILSRVLIRLSQDRMSELWSLAFDLISSSYTYDNIGLPKQVKDFFESLIVTSNDNTLELHLCELAKLPKWALGLKSQSFDLHFPNFLDNIRFRKLRLNFVFSKEVLISVIQELFRFMESDSQALREAAASRLISLWELKVLSAEQETKLREIFWKSVEAKDIPKGWKYYSSIWLTFQPIIGEPIEERLRKWAIPTCDENQAAIVNVDRLHFWLQVSRIKKSSGISQLVWSLADVKLMLQYIQIWWNKVGKTEQAAKISDHQFSAWARPHSDQIVQDAIQVLAEIVFPKVYKQKTSYDNVICLIREMAKAGVPIGSAIPWLHALCPADKWDRMLYDYLTNQSEPEVFKEAVYGLCFWIKNALNQTAIRGRVNFPLVPNDLYLFMGTLLAVRVWPGLDKVLIAVREVYENEVQIPKEFHDEILQGLDRLFFETAYTKPDNPRSATIPYEAIPWCRYLSAKLTIQMAHVGFENKPVIKKWLEGIKTDPLPEIRQLQIERVKN